MPARTKKRAMTDDHKAALAEGRNPPQRIVSRYLEALEAHQNEAWAPPHVGLREEAARHRRDKS